MQVDTYFRNIEKVTLQVDIYFRNIKKVTLQVGAGDFHTDSPAGYFHSKSPARSPYSQLIVSCTATTIITTVPLFNYPHYCHSVKEGPALCVFCSAIFTISGLFDDIVRSTYIDTMQVCLLYTSPSPRDRTRSRMPSSA